MHVAMVTPLPPDCNAPRGGVEAVAVCLIRALIRAGCRVTVIKWGTDRDAPYHDAALDCDVVPLRLRHPAVLANWLSTPRELRRIVDDLRPDVVHIQDIPEFGLALSGPRVLTVHGINPRDEWLSGGVRRFVTVPIMAMTFHRSIKAYDHVVLISPYPRQALCFGRDARLHEIDNPVDDEFFDVARAEQAPTVLTVGLLSALKNTRAVVETAARIRRAVPDVRFRIAGPWRAGSVGYRRAVERLREETDLRDTVPFLGSLSRQEILAELAGASCLLLPSFQENAPRVIAEAMAAGVPVAASKVGGIPWMVRDGETGRLFEPTNLNQMVEAVQGILTDDQQRARMGQAARREAERRFRPDAVAARIIDVYRQAIRDHGGQQ